MAKQTINIGTAPNDGTGTPLRTAFDYCNLNFTELYTAVGPSGNNIVVPGSATITGNLTVDTNTLFVDSANNRVGIGTASPADSLHVFGSGNALIEGTAGLYARTNYKVGAKTWQVGYRSGTTQFEIQEDLVERYTIGNGGTPHTWYIGASTAMTLNSTGLGVGGVPSGVNRFAVWNGATQAMTLDTSGRLLVGSSASGTAAGDGVVKLGAYGHCISQTGTSIASGSSIDITVVTSGAGYQGFLSVANTQDASANTRTQTTYSVFGRGTASTITQIATANGSLGGASFTVTTPSNGVIRITNTSGLAATISAQFFGGVSA
jgi:hypothetical protein